MSTIINTVAEKLGLPYWWVESIAIEYTECREYAIDGKLWVFDWDKLSESDLKEAIQSHKVVIRDYLIHNIHKNVFPSRAADSLANRILPSMPKETTDLIPEGLVSDYAFPFCFNSDDPKQSFSQWFQVLDDGKFWQWRIAEFIKVEGRNYGKWFSKEIDLEPLDQIHEKLISLKKSAVSSGEPGYAEFKLKVKQFYQWL